MKDLDGKVIVITGATGGIGTRQALELIDLGACVTLVDRDPDDVDALAARLGGKALAAPLDVTDRAGWDAVVARTLDRFGSIAGLVNFAGILPAGSIEQTDPAQMELAFRVNVIGTLLMGWTPPDGIDVPKWRC